MSEQKDLNYPPYGGFPAAKPEELEKALKHKAWQCTEALCWLLGRTAEFGLRQLPRHARMEIDSIDRAIKSGWLTQDSTPPRQWIEFAIELGWDVPPIFKEFVKPQGLTSTFLLREAQQSAPERVERFEPGNQAIAKPDPYTIALKQFAENLLEAEIAKRDPGTQSGFSNEQKTSGKKRFRAKRKDRLTAAILEAKTALREKLKREPTADEVFHHLANDDETGVIADSTDDKLIWTCTKGNLHDTSRKALANRLSRLNRPQST